MPLHHLIKTYKSEEEIIFPGNPNKQANLRAKWRTLKEAAVEKKRAKKQRQHARKAEAKKKQEKLAEDLDSLRSRSRSRSRSAIKSDDGKSESKSRSRSRSSRARSASHHSHDSRLTTHTRHSAHKEEEMKPITPPKDEGTEKEPSTQAENEQQEEPHNPNTNTETPPPLPPFSGVTAQASEEPATDDTPWPDQQPGADTAWPDDGAWPGEQPAAEGAATETAPEETKIDPNSFTEGDAKGQKDQLTPLDRYLAQKKAKYFGEKDLDHASEETKVMLDDHIITENLDFTHHAYFFSAAHDHASKMKSVVPENIVARCGIKLEAHMNTLTLTLEDPATRRKHNLPPWIDTEGDTPEDNRTYKGSDAHELPQTALAIRLNYQAAGPFRSFGLLEQDVDDLPTNFKRYINTLPECVREKAQKIVNTGARPVWLETGVKLEFASVSGDCFWSPPEWAIDFLDALNQGAIAVLFAGHNNTVHQLHLPHEVFSIDGRRNPLDKWHVPARRRVFKWDMLPAEPRFGVPKEKYRYSSKYTFHDYDEYSTIFGSAMSQEVKASKEQYTLYEKKAHKAHFVKIPGSKDGGAYLAFLPVSFEDDVRFSEGDRLEIEFLDREAIMNPSDDAPEAPKPEAPKPEAPKPETTSPPAEDASTSAPAADKSADAADNSEGKGKDKGNAAETEKPAAEPAPLPSAGIIDSEDGPGPLLFFGDYDWNYEVRSIEDSCDGYMPGSSLHGNHALLIKIADLRSALSPADGIHRRDWQAIWDLTIDFYHSPMTPRCAQAFSELLSDAGLTLDMKATSMLDAFRAVGARIEGSSAQLPDWVYECCSDEDPGIHAYDIPNYGLPPSAADEPVPGSGSYDDEQPEDDDEVKSMPDWEPQAHRARGRAQAKKGKGKGKKKDLAPGQVDESENPNRIAWSGTVSSYVSYCPPTHFPVFIYRPWDSQTQTYDPLPVDTVSTRDLDDQLLMQAIRVDPGMNVLVKIKFSDKAQAQNIFRLDDFTTKFKERPEHNEWNENMKKVLVNGDLTDLPTGDLFEDVRDEFPLPHRFMKGLNAQSKVAVLEAEDAPARLQIIVGPPGTGKTYLSTRYAIPFFLHTQVHQILAIAPTNEAVNSTAQQMLDTLQQCQKHFKKDREYLKDRYVLRVHSKATEEQIRLRTNQPYVRDASSRPQVASLTDLVAEELDEIAPIIQRHFDQTNNFPVLGIHDKRLKSIQLSPALRMLIVAGLIRPKGSKAPLPQAWENFRFFYKMKLNRTIEMSKDQKEQYARYSSELYNYVLRNASVVCATTFQAGTAAILEALTDTVSLIIHDEACREREDNLFPLFGCRFTKIKGMLMIGDPRQLPPVALHSWRENAFYKQLRIALMTRLMRTGFRSVMLTIQNRMVEDLCELANQLTYANQLTCGPYTHFNNRPIARTFRDFVKKLTKNEPKPGEFHCRARNYLFIDIRQIKKDEGNKNWTSIDGSGSRYNEFYVCYIINLVLELVKKLNGAKIGLLTGYIAQRNLYLSALAQMLADPDLDNEVKEALRNLHIDTFDGAQSKEYDVVVADILVTDTTGFLSNYQRINVATTRARDGMIVIGTRSATCKARGRLGAVDDFECMLYPEVHQISGVDRYPVCPYFKPGYREFLVGIAESSSQWFEPADKPLYAQMQERKKDTSDAARAQVGYAKPRQERKQEDKDGKADFGDAAEAAAASGSGSADAATAPVEGEASASGSGDADAASGEASGSGTAPAAATDDWNAGSTSWPPTEDRAKLFMVLTTTGDGFDG